VRLSQKVGIAMFAVLGLIVVARALFGFVWPVFVLGYIYALLCGFGFAADLYESNLPPFRRTQGDNHD